MATSASFCYKKKRGKKILSPRCLDINSKSASLFLAFPVLPGEKSQVWLSEIEEPGWWIHCDRSTTNWSKAASSPPNYLPALSDVPWKISHMHPDAAFTFKQSWFILSVIWKTSNIFFLFLSPFFFFLSQKPPWRGWLHGIHHHASLMTSGQEHGVKSQ